MYILNIEDNVFKHIDISKAIGQGSFADLKIDRAETLFDGILLIEESIEQENCYDLIITDMWYPEKSGGAEVDSGEKLISTVKEKGWDIPVILCSSVNYRYPEILGSVFYSKNGDWELELVKLIKKI